VSIPLGARFTAVVAIGCIPQRTVCIRAGIVYPFDIQSQAFIILTITRFLITRVRISTKPPQVQDMTSTLVDLK